MQSLRIGSGLQEQGVSGLMVWGWAVEKPGSGIFGLGATCIC